MYISKKYNVAYFATPRVGSNTVQKVLIDSLDDPDAIITGIDSVLSGPMDGNALFYPNSPEVKELDAFHLSPAQAIEKGYVTAEELKTMTCFSFVRNPLERFVSRFVLAKTFKLYEAEERATMIIAIRNGLFEGRDNLALSFKWAYKDYFFYNGEQICTPYRLENINTVLPEIVRSVGGTVPETIPHLQVGNPTPEKLKEPMTSWMPKDCIEILELYFREDISFYESVPLLT